MKATLCIAHASDVHLDTDYHGGASNLASRDYYRGVFRSLLERIVARRPDLLLMPGDLFDSNRVSPGTIAWAIERLGGMPFPVMMIPGNHDCLEEGAIYRRHDFERAENVQMLLHPGGERRRLPDLGVAVWGRGMVSHHPSFLPLAGLPAPLPNHWNLAMGHGIYLGSGGNGVRSSPIHGEQIARSGYDYLALGHHHALLDVSQGATGAFFCGAPVSITPEGRGTFLIVTLEQGGPPRVEIHRLD